MKVLFIGGTGTISTACTRLAAARGIDLYLFNRGHRQVEIPAGVSVIKGDINADEDRQRIDPEKDATMDRIVTAYTHALV